MSILDSIFGKDIPQAPQSNALQGHPACKNERELLELYGGIAYEKQIDLGDVIGKHNWNVDMKKGEISFGPSIVFPIQVLGTFSHSSQTWLWAWANTQSGLSDAVQQHAVELKNYGEENDIDLLTVDEFDAAKSDLHKIGLIASGMFKSTGYYLADYGKGIMVVTVKSDAIDTTRKDNHHRIMTVFPQLISEFSMNHKPALINYLRAKGYSINDEEASLTLTATKGVHKLVATFDHQLRLANITG